MKRRDILALSGLSLSTSLAALAQGEGGLVFNGAGGSWQENARKAWLEPFAKQTGIKVIDTTPFDIGKLSAMVKTKLVQWDVTDMPATALSTATSNKLLEPIDYSIVDKLALPFENFGTHTVAYGAFSNNFAYDPRKFSGAKPKSWADFWDTKRFPGPRGIRKVPLATLEAALLADGVANDKLYPLDLKRAFRKLDQIKKDVRWWSAAQQSVQLITSGEVSMGMTFPSRVFAARKQGASLEVEWNQSLLGRTRFAVPRGAPNKVNGMRMINFIIQAEQEGRFANLNRSAPTSIKAFKYIDADVIPELVTARANSFSTIPLDELGFWLRDGDAITREFESWLVS